MNTRVEELYDRIYTDESTKDPRRFIQIVESDLSIVNVSNNDSMDKKLIRLVADYGLFLVKAGYIKKSISYIEKAIRWFESDQNITNLWNEPMYEALIFNRGVVNYRLQNRKKAKADFKLLTQKYPDNDLYQNWLKSEADINYGRIEWLFVGIATISIFFSFVLDKEDGIVDKLAFYGIFVGLLGGLIVNLIRKQKLRIK